MSVCRTIDVLITLDLYELWLCSGWRKCLIHVFVSRVFANASFTSILIVCTSLTMHGSTILRSIQRSSYRSSHIFYFETSI